MDTSDNDNVDSLLIKSLGLEEMGNIEPDIKYPKGVFSPSSKPDEATTTSSLPPQKASSPHNSISPHPVPHFQHSVAAPPQPPAHSTIPRMSPIPQGNFQHPSHHHHISQRKVQLGPNFDRLGILNQANEIPPMSTPYFAKALQQHGGGTLGAILQAHQQALQQQMHRENYLLQQAVHQQMFQGVPFNPMYLHHQRMGGMVMDRRTDDQIVPNPQMIPPPDSWIKHSGHPSPRRRMKRKHSDAEHHERRQAGYYRDTLDISEKYVIFNDENQSNQMSEDECSSPRIAPPKDSVFVRYPVNSTKTLPSFSDAFSGHIEKLKVKEQHLKNSLIRHGVNELIIPDVYPIHHAVAEERMNPAIITEHMMQRQVLPQQCPQLELLQTTANIPTDLQEAMDPLAGIVEQVIPEEGKGILSDGNDAKASKPVKGSQASETSTIVKSEEEDNTMEKTDSFSQDIDASLPLESANANTPAIKMENESGQENESKDLEYLNDISGAISEKVSFSETKAKLEDTSSGETNCSTNNDKNESSPRKNNEQSESEIVVKSEDAEGQTATNNINIFEENLDLDTDNRNYDNLFNGNSDEHYFQAFKENNLHLIGDLGENQVDGGAGDDIMKLLHSPLDFLNDKFLR